MANSTQLIVKFSADNRAVTVSFADVMNTTEVWSAGMVGVSTPTGLTATATGHTDNSITLTVGSGVSGQSYGIPVTLNTDEGNIYTKVLAVVVNDNIASAYENVNDVAFNAVMGKLEAGTAGLAVANFMLPPGSDVTSGVVEWVLLDKDGLIYASGQAFDYQITNTPNGVRAEAQAVIGAPSDMTPTLEGQMYQIRWSLKAGTQQFYSFESLEITGGLTVPEGVEDIVELVGTSELSVYMQSDRAYDRVTVEIYQRNEKKMNAAPAVVTKTTNGWQYSALLTGLDLAADLEPYTLMWSLSNVVNPTYVDRQAGRLFIINPTLMQATNDMRILINKSNTSILSTQDIIFTVPLLLAYLRRGRDYFNIAWGMFTGFTMMNASGGIREYWLKCSEVIALRAQFLAEGEKVFNFQGQAISLDVDRTQYYDSLANSIQQDLDTNGKAIKQNLIKKGIIGGDGNVDNPQIGAPGHMGTVGITLSPATNWIRYGGRFGGVGSGGGLVY
jgi:hypothetical protein